MFPCFCRCSGVKCGYSKPSCQGDQPVLAFRPLLAYPNRQYSGMVTVPVTAASSGNSPSVKRQVMGQTWASPRASLCGLPATTWRGLDEHKHFTVAGKMTKFSVVKGQSWLVS